LGNASIYLSSALVSTSPALPCRSSCGERRQPGGASIQGDSIASEIPDAASERRIYKPWRSFWGVELLQTTLARQANILPLCPRLDRVDATHAESIMIPDSGHGPATTLLIPGLPVARVEGSDNAQVLRRAAAITGGHSLQPLRNFLYRGLARRNRSASSITSPLSFTVLSARSNSSAIMWPYRSSLLRSQGPCL
jgi:hypothetical protein